MRASKMIGAVLAAALLSGAAMPSRTAMASAARAELRRQQQEQDYLTSAEADKIRDAVTPSDRIMLFMGFADERLKKLKYTLAHSEEFPQNRAEEINGLINAYSGCIDDASDLVDLARQKQQDIRGGIKSIKGKIPEFLAYLQELNKTGAEIDLYKENLDDAIQATLDALDTATKAEKEISAPVRRKH